MVTPFHLFMFYKKLSEKLKKQRGACSAIQIYSAGGGQHFSRHFDYARFATPEFSPTVDETFRSKPSDHVNYKG
jgi:hypothetical protein